MLLSPNAAPKLFDIPEISNLMRKLETNTDIKPQWITESKIQEVFKKILELEEIPADREFRIRERSEKLLARFSEVRRAGSQNPAPGDHPDPQSIPSQAVVKNEVPELTCSELSPAICITQLTPAQCSKVEKLALTTDPPLDRAVVELICSLPYFSGTGHRETYQVAAFGNVFDPVRELEDDLNRERRLDGWGSKIPSHILQLTAWDGNYGRALFVDTKTWEGTILKDYQLTDPDERDPKWEHLVGDRKSIEEILQGWIDNFLEGRWIPSGGEMVHEEGPRRVVDILMVS